MSQQYPQDPDPRGQMQPYPPQQPPQWGYSYPPQPFVQQPVQMNVHPRSPAAALVMSLFIPGLGSMYAGKPGWGILILVLWLASCVLLLIVIGAFLLPVIWIWGMIAGYSHARAWNRARGIDS